VLLAGAGIVLGALKEAAKLAGWPAWASVVLVAAGALGALALLIQNSRVEARETQAAKTRGDEELREELASLLRFGPPLPTLGSIQDKPVSLGVHASSIAEGYRRSGEPRPPYVKRVIDADVVKALETDEVVLVYGRSNAGKSRTALEAALQVFADKEVMVPESPGSLPRLVDVPFTPATDAILLWLDGLQNYLDAEAVSLRLLERLRERLRGRDGRAARLVVLATIPTVDRARLREDRGSVGQEARELLAAAREFELTTGADSFDPDQAEVDYGGLNLDSGIGAALTQKDELLNRYTGAASPVGAAFVRTAAAWRRMGLVRPISEDRLLELARFYLPGALLTAERCTAGLEFANEELPSSARLLEHVDGGFQAAGQVVEFDQEHSQEIPEALWEAVVSDTELTWAELSNAGFAAYLFGNLTQAERALRRAADAGNSDAASHLGTVLAEQGRTEEAKSWLMRAGERETDAAFSIGKVLAERGRTEEAERWYRRAAEAGHTGAAFSIGEVLVERGRTEEAEPWLKRAAEAGHTGAAFSIGEVLAEQGRTEEAEPWLRRAGAAGNSDAAIKLGNLLVEQGRSEEAEPWLMRAAEEGHTGAAFSLGNLLAEQGRTEEAEPWLMRAAEEGYTGASFSLGVVLAKLGRAEQAESWLMRSGKGKTDAAFTIGAVLIEQGRTEEAESWVTRAVEAKRRLKPEPWLMHAGEGEDAAFIIGAVLAKLGKAEEAEPWLRRAAKVGHGGAAVELSILLAEQGRTEEAERSLMRPGTGKSGAAFSIGKVLAERGRAEEAERWYRRAAEAGHTGAAYNLGELLAEQGRREEAERWLRPAADRGVPEAAELLARLARGSTAGDLG
jgi:TPR repeat protein